MQLSLMDTKVPSFCPPFRYTGGKRKLQREIEMMMPSGTKEMLSPFVGGAAIELKLASSGIKVYAHDWSPFITDFWEGFLSDPKEVCVRAFKFYEYINYIDDKQKVKRIINGLSNKRKVLGITNIYARAAILWVLNGMVRDGQPGAYFCNNKTEHGANNGLYWGIRRPEFYLDERFSDWSNNNFTVERLDWRVSMAKYPNIFMYGDPPYIGKDALYDKRNPPFEHEEFAREMKLRESKWILSYGDHHKIRNLYSDYKILKPTWTKQSSNPKYTKERKAAEELLILNL